MKKENVIMVEQIEEDLLNLQRKVFKYGNGIFTDKHDDILIRIFDVLIDRLDELKANVGEAK